MKRPATTSGDSDELRRQRAEAHYVAALLGGEVDVERLCAEHPKLAEVLREVDADWRRAARIHDALAAAADERRPATPPAPSTAPTVVAPAESRSAKASDSLPIRVVERLESHAPKQSRYEVVGEVGQGGMGTVLKVWDSDLHRTLAMKVAAAAVMPKTDTVAEEQLPLARFLEEAQVTGQLDHPGVVPVHELGVDDDGRIYFTMRLVRGRDLEKVFELVAAEAEGWTTTRAVRVVLQVCQTMAFAHGKNVIHRDLKPANVMVGSFGEVYVMDWGLARVRDREDVRNIRIRPPRDPSSEIRTDRLADRTAKISSPLMTMDGDVVGTPAYMSPEQARGEVTELDDRSDVYSVGAMLYHLLAGHMPYVPPGDEVTAFDVWERVRKGPPAPLAERAPDAPPELVAIAEKAMAREPDQRYDGMLLLAGDLQAYLDDRVVKAYERGAAAELRKWVRRNKATAAAGALAILATIVGLGAAAWIQGHSNARLEEKNVELAEAKERAETNESRALLEGVRANENALRAEERAAEARREREASDRVVDFLVGLFESPDPRRSGGETVTAKELLDRAAQTISVELATEPLLAARMRDAMGRAYHSLGLYDEAEPLLASALETRRTSLGARHADTLASALELGVLYKSDGRYDEALRQVRTALDTALAAHGPDHDLTLRALHDLARVHFFRGEYARSEELYLEALAGRERVLAPAAPETLLVKSNLALLYRKAARYAEAATLLEETVAGYASTTSADDPDTLSARNDLAGVYLLQGDAGAALPVFEDVLARRRRVLGPDHPDTLITQSDLASLHLMTSDYGEAARLFEQVLELQRGRLAPDHPHTLTTLVNLASAYQSLGRHEEAEPLLIEAIEASRRVRGADHANTLAAQNALGYLYMSVDRLDDALALFDEALAGHREALAPDHPMTLRIQQNMIDVLLRLGLPHEAAPLARELVELTPSGDPELPERRAILERIEAELERGGG